MRSRPRPRLDLGPHGPAAPLLLALAVGALWALPAGARAEAQRGATPPDAAISAATLEARHGLRVTRVAVTGGGGLVDLRFTVVDPEKARPLLEGHGRGPRLVVEPGGAALEAPHHGGGRSVRLAKDAACFVLFPNARGAVRAGGRVAVDFGQVRLQPVTAQ